MIKCSVGFPRNIIINENSQFPIYCWLQSRVDKVQNSTTTCLATQTPRTHDVSHVRQVAEFAENQFVWKVSTIF